MKKWVSETQRALSEFQTCTFQLTQSFFLQLKGLCSYEYFAFELCEQELFPELKISDKVYDTCDYRGKLSGVSG